MEFKMVCQGTNPPSSQIVSLLNKVPIKIQSLSVLIGSGRWQAAQMPAFLVSKGLELRKKVNWVKSCSILSSVSWVVVFICVLCPGCLTLEHNGSGTILIACSPPEAQRWNCLWSSGVRVGHTFSSWNNSFLYTLITKLISYYLDQRFSTLESSIIPLPLGYTLLFLWDQFHMEVVILLLSMCLSIRLSGRGLRNTLSCRST